MREAKNKMFEKVVKNKMHIQADFEIEEPEIGRATFSLGIYRPGNSLGKIILLW